MKEQILKIIEDKTLIAFDSSSKWAIVKEITSNICEFIEWMLQNIEVVPYSTGYYLIGSGLDYMSVEELYQYWLNNVHKPSK